MGIFSKIGTLLKSNLNDMISKAEDPEKMLNQVLVDMKQQLIDAKKQVAAAIGDEKRLKRQYQDQIERCDEWERKAILAVEAGDDNLAREALSRKAEHERPGTLMQEQWIAQKEAVEQLKDSLRHLNNKIEEARRKKNILVARKKRAEAQNAIHQTMAGLNDTSAFETFERMAKKIEQLEAEAEAGLEVAGELTGDRLERRFAQLEAGRSTDQELLALKTKMGLLPAGETNAPQPLPKGKDRAADTTQRVEDELAALKEKVRPAEE